MGIPFGATQLLFQSYIVLSVLLFLAWLVIGVFLVNWLAKEKLVRKPFSLLIMAVMSICYFVVFWAKFNT